MYEFLFSMSSIASISWLMMIFFPTLKYTKWIIKSEIFPLMLSLSYTVGLLYFILHNGVQFMADFGDYDGVVRLMKIPEVSVIAWIHILAFDQLIGRMIYLENMEKKSIPTVVQSIIIFFTLMLGPLGYILYKILKKIFKESNSKI